MNKQELNERDNKTSLNEYCRLKSIAEINKIDFMKKYLKCLRDNGNEESPKLTLNLVSDIKQRVIMLN